MSPWFYAKWVRLLHLSHLTQRSSTAIALGTATSSSELKRCIQPVMDGHGPTMVNIQWGCILLFHMSLWWAHLLYLRCNVVSYRRGGWSYCKGRPCKHHTNDCQNAKEDWKMQAEWNDQLSGPCAANWNHPHFTDLIHQEEPSYFLKRFGDNLLRAIHS